jgi:acetylglutamate kinase
VPVISAVGSDTFGNLYNINADTGAAAIAAALKAKSLVLVTDVDGLYLQWPDKNSLVSRIAKKDVRTLLPTVESGMRPKLEAALRALDGGVVHVNLINGNPIRNIEDLLIHGKDLGTLVHS